MASNSYKAKVPGSLMLFGEHAVLCGKTALVAAVDKHITVTLTPRNDDVIHLNSAIFGEYSVQLTRLNAAVEDRFKFVLAALERCKSDLKHGFDLLIEADFSHTVGFGSSAAVTVATLAVLKYAIYDAIPDKLSLFDDAFKVVQSVQKIGSGADIAASIFGGILAYRKAPFSDLFIDKLPCLIPLTVIYSGSKVATPIVVEQVRSLQAKHLKVFDDLYAAMEQCTLEAIIAIKKQDWQALGELMNIHQGLQDALGVNNARLSELVFSLRSRKEIKGAKISGAGCGDCVIGLGKVSDFGVGQMEVELSNHGIECWKDNN